MTGIRVLSLGMIMCAAIATVGQEQKTNMGQQNLCSDFTVVEFRRYLVREGQRENFGKYFDAYFPEAMQQLGAIAAGQFYERDNPLHFTWIRGFHSMDDRAKANANLYYGPVWHEHKALMNSLMTDSDNVLLLHAIEPECGIAVLPSVDPVKEPDGAKGIAVAQVFAVKPERLKEFEEAARKEVAAYQSAGVKETGLFETLDVTNNFPQLPVRTDGPFVVWFGVARDASVVEQQFRPLAMKAAEELKSAGFLRAETELVILDPTSRSRMRWLPEWR